MSYLNRLKVAVINENLKEIELLIEKEPEYDSIEEAQEIIVFFNLAKKLLQNEKQKLSVEMKKIKDLKKFNQTQRKEKINFKI